MELVKTNPPDRFPTAVGANVTTAVQLTPAFNLPPAQVLALSPNPAAFPAVLMFRASPFSVAKELWLVTVSVTGAAEMWIPVTPNATTAAGEVSIPGGKPPVPLSAVLAAAEPPASAVTELTMSDPTAAPLTTGLNDTPTRHLAPAPSTFVQVVFVASMAKPALVITSKSDTAVCPEFVTVTTIAPLVLPTSVVPKFTTAGVVPSSTPLKPVPLKLVLSLATPAVLLDAVRNAVRPPASVGLKLTSREQLPPAASDPPQLEEPTEKSSAELPVITVESPVRPSPPWFVTVTACPTLVVPTVPGANESVRGLRTNVGASTPVPDTASSTAATPRLELAIVTTLLSNPPASGVKVTGTTQLAPAARLVPQLPLPTLNGAAATNLNPPSAPVPGFATVNCNGALFVPTSTAPNCKNPGVTANTADGRPVPVRPSTTCV